VGEDKEKKIGDEEIPRREIPRVEKVEELHKVAVEVTCGSTIKGCEGEEED